MKKLFTLFVMGAFCLQLSAQETYPRKIVMEEGTGTWCGWCVRGIETIKMMAELAPDNFIGIGIHDGDEMDNTENYGPIKNRFQFFPGCIINRRSTETEEVDLSIAYAAVEELKNSAVAKIEAAAQFEDDSQSSVLVKTNTTFGFDDNAANYRIAYVVVEDHVGPYMQRNFYSGMGLAENDYMYEWTISDAVLSIEFNDVARGIYPNANGQDGSIPTTVSKGEPLEYEYSLTLPGNVANKENVSIVTLLIDGGSGEIVNADKTAIGEGNATGIQTIKSEAVKSDEWYNLKGQRVGQPTKGLYIKNGKKVIVR